MAPTVYTPNGRLELSLLVMGITHKIRVPCQIVDPTVVPVQLIGWLTAFPTVNVSTCAQSLWDFIRVFYPNTVVPPSWTIYNQVAGVFSPVRSGTTTTAGTDPLTNWLAAQTTYVFADADNHRFKIVVPEPSTVPPFHSPDPTSDSRVAALVNSMISPAVAQDLGNFVRSRGAFQIKAFRSYTGTLNRKTRRRRGLV
jgi:hypothetical protein